MKHDLSSMNTTYILYAPYVQLHVYSYICTATYVLTSWKVNIYYILFLIRSSKQQIYASIKEI